MQEGTLHKLISDADSRLGASWYLGKPPSRSRKCLHRRVVRGCRAPPECALKSRIVACASGAVALGVEGREVGREVCHPVERRSVGRRRS